VGGTVTGLVGSVTLANNGGDSRAVSADGAFTFATSLAGGAAYAVTVTAQPATQTCTVASGAGNVGAANVTDVAVTCTTNVMAPGSADIGPAGGTVHGEYGAQIIIPPGALANTVTIGLHRDSSNAPAVTAADMDAVGAVWELTPPGQAFTLPVTVRVPFDAEQVANDADPVLYKAEVGGAFAPLATTASGGFLEATIANFSWVLPAAAATRPRLVYGIRNTAGALDLVSLRIDRTTGTLGTPTSEAATGDYPTSVVAHPSGKFLYVTNAGTVAANGIDPNSVALYRLSTVNGKILGPAASSVTTRQPVNIRPTMPVIHPNGQFLYVINFGSVTANAGSDIDEFRINASTGALTLTGAAISGNGAQPMGMVFDRLGSRSFVVAGGAHSANPLSSVIARYEVDPATGAFAGPQASTPVCGLGNAPWSIAIDPNGRSLHVACLTGNQIASFGIDAGTGALSSLGTITVQDKPASLAADSFGRFIFAAKQQPFFTVNMLGYRMDAGSGALTFANQVLSGCTGSCVGPVATIAEPQGNFVYSVDTTGSLGSLRPDPVSGVLTASGARSGMWVPTPGGIGFPFTFAATGVSPVWQPNCTVNCALLGTVSSGGNPPSNPAPPTSHYLSVSIGAYFGTVTSSPGGIDYSPPTNGNPLGSNDFSSDFPAGSVVQLCSSPPPQPAGAYDITWTGGCSGSGQCTSVTMTADKFCHANFQPRLP
jgi:6-phosphogluconolactonase (cycloisomerase 2 family)